MNNTNINNEKMIYHILSIFLELFITYIALRAIRVIQNDLYGGFIIYMMFMAWALMIYAEIFEKLMLMDLRYAIIKVIAIFNLVYYVTDFMGHSPMNDSSYSKSYAHISMLFLIMGICKRH